MSATDGEFYNWYGPYLALIFVLHLRDSNISVGSSDLVDWDRLVHTLTGKKIRFETRCMCATRDVRLFFRNSCSDSLGSVIVIVSITAIQL